MIKYLVMDVDGTLTDGKIYMGPMGEAMKAFSVKDGYVINHILKPLGITPIVITARSSSIVENRCAELGITEVYQGKLDKFEVLKSIVGDDGLTQCAYFGDDVIDLKCMKPIKEAGGIVGCPFDAVKEVKAISDYICLNKAGDGSLREFVEWFIQDNNNDVLNRRIESAIAFLNEVTVSEEMIGKRVQVDDDFFYTIQSYTTKQQNACKLESHRDYVDIQIVVKGNELMEICDISRLFLDEEYDEEKDVMYWRIPNRIAKVTLVPGSCIVLYPEDAHKGAISIGKNENVVKIVGKIKI